MFREVYRWNVIDAVKDNKEVYAIRRMNNSAEVVSARVVTLKEYADEKNMYYVEWVEQNE